MTALIVARHGNTFDSGETPRRVGARTDLALTGTGREQAARLGQYLKAHRLVPDVTYASALKRAQETAQIAVREAGYKQPVYTLDIFNEIDHGPDEDKTDAEIVARIGEEALKAWDREAKVPPGWLANPEKIIADWEGFAKMACMYDDNETVLVVTSNGVARFAPYITGDYEGFRARHNIKLATGALALFRHSPEGGWTVEGWNIRP
jgi:probable phosphoglycerate mutase